MTTHNTALEAAVTAYDAERRARNGDKPMSEANKATIAPMIESAITAYLNALGAEPVAWTFYRSNGDGTVSPVIEERKTRPADASTEWTVRPLYASPVVPGHVLVPEEPTEAMISAGLESLAESTGEPLGHIDRDAVFAYRAMLAAAKEA